MPKQHAFQNGNILPVRSHRPRVLGMPGLRANFNLIHSLSSLSLPFLPTLLCRGNEHATLTLTLIGPWPVVVVGETWKKNWFKPATSTSVWMGKKSVFPVDRGEKTPKNSQNLFEFLTTKMKPSKTEKGLPCKKPKHKKQNRNEIIKTKAQLLACMAKNDEAHPHTESWTVDFHPGEKEAKSLDKHWPASWSSAWESMLSGDHTIHTHTQTLTLSGCVPYGCQLIAMIHNICVCERVRECI